MPQQRKPMVTAPARSVDTLQRVYSKYEGDQTIPDRQIDGKMDSYIDSNLSRKTDTYLSIQADNNLPSEVDSNPDRQTDGLIESQTFIDDAKAKGQSAMKTSGLKIPSEFDDWMEEIVFTHRKQKLTKQDLLRRGLELVYVEVMENGGEFSK